MKRQTFVEEYFRSDPRPPEKVVFFFFFFQFVLYIGRNPDDIGHSSLQTVRYRHMEVKGVEALRLLSNKDMTFLTV